MILQVLIDHSKRGAREDFFRFNSMNLRVGYFLNLILKGRHHKKSIKSFPAAYSNMTLTGIYSVRQNNLP
jgi:hypothetical protein